MGKHGHNLRRVRPENSLRARMVYWYAHHKYSAFAQVLDLTTTYSGLLPRHLPPQPLPRLHLPQIRSFSRRRHRHGRRRPRRPTILPPHEERPRIQALCAPPPGIQVLARGDAGGVVGILLQLERDFQLAGVLAGVGGVLVDFGVFDDEEADTEYDQVQVRLHA